MADDLEIRAVRPDEHSAVGAVTALAYREFDPGHSPEWAAYLERIADIAGRATRTRVLVALLGSTVVGSTTVELDHHVETTWTEPLAPDEAHMRMLGVHPEYRRRGVARSLVHACMALARAQGRRRLTLETTDRMLAARALYESMGFRWVGSREVARGLHFQDYELRLDMTADAATSASR